jgi:sulfite exporter TauE/SafE
VNSLYLSLAAGAALGAASTLHCAGMCGSIASSLMLSCGGGARKASLRTLVLSHAGRITAYAATGALVGATGASLIGSFDRSIAFGLLQWAGAAALMWIGLSSAGLLPAPSGLDRVLTPVSGLVMRGSFAIGGGGPMASFLGGMAWGMMPCAMVYGALFTAMLTGSAAGGAAVMLGFGAGTLPGLIVTTLGVRTLLRAELRQGMRSAVGIAISLAALATLWVPHAALEALCR